jgi:hypothetical protein
VLCVAPGGNEVYELEFGVVKAQASACRPWARFAYHEHLELVDVVFQRR